MRLLDVEGTVCPVSFVHEVLFPWARERLADFLAAHAADPEVSTALRAVAAESGLEATDRAGLLAVLTRWMDEDRKIGPLKVIQGRIWRRGYLDGALRAPLYDDVVPALDRWRDAGERIAVFSSGSVEAQRLFFGHTVHGDLLDRFAAFFDTRTGPKREARAYREIALRCGVPPSDLVFYSDLVPELDAAAEAGLRTVHVVRDGPLGPSGHRRVSTLDGE